MSLQSITSRLRAAEAQAGRPAGSVTLIAVSKVQPAERVEAVLEEGQRIFGENRVQEAQGKWPLWRERHGPVGEARDGRRAGHVQRRRVHARAVRAPELVGEGLQPPLPAGAEEQRAVPRGQPAGGGRADASGGAGHHRHRAERR